MSLLTVHVAVGVICDPIKGVLIAKRSAHQHQGDLWEFPGGKIETNETVMSALKRELKEELDIDVITAEPLIEISHDYKDKSVILDTWKVTAFSGKAKGLEGQPLLWVNIEHLSDYSFPEANLAIIEAIKQEPKILSSNYTNYANF